ncbi:MAG: GatB/YqeY domain-containing protein [Myxococcota bacterium]
MSIFDDVTTGMKQAMRAREKERLSALRGIRAAFLMRTKEDNSQSLTDEQCVPLLRRLEKQRHESIEAFDGAGRTRQADAERAELEVIRSFLPSLADEAATRAWVEEALAAVGAAGPGDLGRVMGSLMKGHRGEVDGGLARQIAQQLLAELDAEAQTE